MSIKNYSEQMCDLRGSFNGTLNYINEVLDDNITIDEKRKRILSMGKTYSTICSNILDTAKNNTGLIGRICLRFAYRRNQRRLKKLMV